jgi:hypothetical protein
MVEVSCVSLNFSSQEKKNAINRKHDINMAYMLEDRLYIY